MTDDEWASLALLLDKGFKWREPFGASEAEVYRILLDGHEAAQIAGAIRALVARGQVFGPTPGEIVDLLRDPETVAPTFTEMFALVYGHGGVLRARLLGNQTYPDAGAMHRAQVEAWRSRAEGFHPLVHAFCERYGYEHLHSLELDDPEFGPVRKRDLEQAWDAHCEAMAGRDLAAIAAGVRRGNDELSRFDPMSALGEPQHQLPEGA